MEIPKYTYSLNIYSHIPTHVQNEPLFETSILRSYAQNKNIEKTDGQLKIAMRHLLKLKKTGVKKAFYAIMCFDLTIKHKQLRAIFSDYQTADSTLFENLFLNTYINTYAI